MALRRLEGVALDSNGKAIASPTVTVFDADTTTKASIFTTKAGTTAEANPLTGDTAGRWGLYIDTGEYDIKIVGGGNTYTIQDVTVQNLLTHASRHSTGGADPIDPDQITISPSPGILIPPSTGIATSFNNLESYLADKDSALVDLLQNLEAGLGDVLKEFVFYYNDHGKLVGREDDDHTQYHNDTRGDARYYTEAELDAGQLDNRYFTEAEHLNASAGAGDAGKPIKLDAAGHVDVTMVNDADVDHGSIGGLADDDHAQYLLADATRAVTGKLQLDPTGGANEGGELIMKGEGASGDFGFDNFAGNARIFTLAAGKVFQIIGGLGIVLPTAPTADLHAATKKYVDDNVGAGLTSISNTAISAAANFDVTGFDSTLYDNYEVWISNGRPGNNSVTLEMETSTDGGTSFDTGASDYSWSGVEVSEDSTVSGSGDADDSEIQLSLAVIGVGNAANENISMKISVFGPETAEFTIFAWQGTFRDTTTRHQNLSATGSRQSAADVDALRFHWSSGDWVAQGNIQFLGIAQ